MASLPRIILMSIPTTISAYLRAYGNELGEKVLTQFPPLHSPCDPIWPALKLLKRKPFPAQTLAILGIVKRWEEARAAAAGGAADADEAPDKRDGQSQKSEGDQDGRQIAERALRE